MWFSIYLFLGKFLNSNFVNKKDSIERILSIINGLNLNYIS